LPTAIQPITPANTPQSASNLRQVPIPKTSQKQDFDFQSCLWLCRFL